MTFTSYIQIVVLFIFLVLSQVFLFDLIHITGFGKIVVYPLILLLLPIYTPRFLGMIVGFAIGYLIDFLLGTGGLHTAAMTFMAFSRGFVLDAISPSSGYDKNLISPVQEMGIGKFLLLVLIMVFIHQLLYYSIERFSFHNFIFTIRRIATGTILSSATIALLTLLFLARDDKRKI
ncbi:MAG TPA: hypothetical protein VLZ75_06190 [Chitinophagales bacterium]|nr:hypothetical protein [Chitinophagales bacterium]